ncbi:MAG: hypothetical protein FD126_3179 [Elusimicrobia bacterium]|nr:MAG: hypothetical protein FD126_3179 [Elusimicrobiota bacterium]
MPIASLWSSTTQSRPAAFLRSQATSPSRVEALTTMNQRSGPKQETMTSSTMPPRSLSMWEYIAWPGLRRAASLELTFWTKASASLPVTQTCPIWDTSKSPQAVRTAWCSLMMLENWTGRSQPWKSTNRAPDSFWSW